MMKYGWGIKLKGKLMVMSGHAPAQWRDEDAARHGVAMFELFDPSVDMQPVPIPKVFPEGEA